MQREIEELQLISDGKQAEIDELNKKIDNEVEEGPKFVAFKLKPAEPVPEPKIAPGKFAF